MAQPRVVGKSTLADQGRTDDVQQLSPSARVAMMWQLAMQAWLSDLTLLLPLGPKP